MGSALSTFTDLQRSVRSAYMTGPSVLLNDAQELDYDVLGRMLTRDVTEVIKSGPRLEDTLYLDTSSTAEEYLPNDSFSYVNPQMVVQSQADWRFTHDHMTWTKQEFGLWAGSNRNQLLKEKMLIKETRLANSLIGKLKAQRFAIPQTSLMEAQAGRSPASLACVANEFVATTDNGLSTGYTTGTLQTQFHPGTYGDATEWTTYQNVSIAAKANWRNKVAAYDTRQSGAQKNNILRAFRRMWALLSFKSPATMQRYFADETFRKLVIATTIVGWEEVIDLQTSMGDNVQAQNRNDFANLTPQFGGIPIERWDGLNTAQWYPSQADVTGGAVTTEGAAFNKGPRFHFYNFNFIKLVFHEENYFDKSEPRMAAGNQPYTFVCDVDTWNQMWCASRRHHGVVMPLAAAGFAAY